jgi:hypothetical protein
MIRGMAKPSLLVPGCEKAPAKIDLTYKPPGGIPYKVTDADDWWKLAAKPEVKASGIDALGLCHYNFLTRVPAEINYYLRNKVGCCKATPDKKNYMFSSNADPGYVYLPPPNVKPIPEVPGIQPSPEPKLQLNSWLGLGFKFGSTVVVVGIEQMGGMIISIQDLVNQEPQVRTVSLNAQTTRMGLGVGASGGLCLIYISSLRHPSQLNSLLAGGVDFNLALGGNAGSVIKGGKTIGKLKKLQPLIEFIVKVGARTPEALRKALSQPDKVADLYKAIMGLRESLKNETDEPEPSVLIADLPVSGGTEVSVFHAVTEFRVLGQPTIDIQWGK